MATSELTYRRSCLIDVTKRSPGSLSQFGVLATVGVVSGCDHGVVANGYRRVSRDQEFLLPPNLAEWLPPGHLAYFLIDVLAVVDTSEFHRRYVQAGVGRAAYDPDMLLALVIYGYCHGVRSARQISRLCEVDVAFRVLCAQDVPHHATLSRFVAGHEAAVAALFTEVLVVCGRAGLGAFGSVAIDGTKIAADASPAANRTESWLAEQAERMVAEGVATDAAEDAALGGARGDELPAELTCSTSRSARIQAAVADLAAERESRDTQRRSAQLRRAAQRVNLAQQTVERERQALLAEQAERQARQQRAAEQGRTLPGTRPVPVDQHTRLRRARAQLDRAEQAVLAARGASAASSGKERVRNITDPDSRIMPSHTGWVQGFNAQFAVADDGLILATRLTQDTGDQQQFIPMMAAAMQSGEVIAERAARTDTKIALLLADAGYCSDANLTAPGPDRLIATGKRRDLSRAPAQQPATGRPPAKAPPMQTMQHRLRSSSGARAYKRRGATVEPAIGQTKDIIGLRRFRRRGLSAAQAELALGALTANLLKLHRKTRAATN